MKRVRLLSLLAHTLSLGSLPWGAGVAKQQREDALRPSCYGDHPMAPGGICNPQDYAERDCHCCPSEIDCYNLTLETRDRVA